MSGPWIDFTSSPSTLNAIQAVNIAAPATSGRLRRQSRVR